MKEPIFIGGPSGVGKSYLTQHLISSYYCRKVVTLTTRPPRNEDIHGIHYEFISNKEFLDLEASNQLVLTDQIFGYRYGLRQGVVEEIVQSGYTPICEVYSPHIRLFTDLFPRSAAVFLKPDSISLLKHRMQQRGDTAASISPRLIQAQEELCDFDRVTHRYFTRSYTVTENNFQDIVNDIVKLFIQN